MSEFAKPSGVAPVDGAAPVYVASARGAVSWSRSVSLLMLAARSQASLVAVPFHNWVFPDGRKWAEFYRQDSGILIRFSELADFELSSDGVKVTCIPVPGVLAATVEHLYLNQILPLALNRLGKLAFHASAVAIGRGAVSFSAEAARGKSTLAAAFATGGLAFLTDDGLVLEPVEGRYEVQPSHPSIRLWADSEQNLLAGTAQEAPPVSYTPKARLLAGPTLPYCEEARPLLAAFFLGEGLAEAVAIRRLTPAEALMEWTRQSFLADVEDKALIGGHFDRTATLANRVPAFALDYPRRYDLLPQVRDAIRACVQSLSPLSP